MGTTRSGPLLVLLAAGAIATTGCGGESSSQPRSCTGMSCAGGGTCFEEGGLAWCNCPTGFHPSGTTCVADNETIPCDGVTCNDHGWCHLRPSSTPMCECFPGYHVSTTSPLVCVPDAVEPDGGDGDVRDGDARDGDGEVNAEIEGDGPDDGTSDGDGDADASDCPALLGGACNVVRQCDCLETSERCILTPDPVGGGYIETCGVLGTQPARSACDGTLDPCAAGTQCMLLFGEWACEQFCIGGADCPTGTTCRGRFFGDVLYGACTPPTAACAPVSGAGCVVGQACRVIPGPSLQSYCGTEGTTAEGASCLSVGCQLGFACNVGTGGVTDVACRKFCRTAAVPSDCTSGTCTDVYLNGSVGLCLP